MNSRPGKGGSPLSYVTRFVVDLPEVIVGDVDPGFGLPSRHEELVRRTRHDGPDYARTTRRSGPSLDRSLMEAQAGTG